MITTRLSLLAGLLVAALTLISSTAHASQRTAPAGGGPLGARPSAKPAGGQVARSLSAAMKAWRGSRLSKAGVRTTPEAAAASVAPLPCADTTTVPDASNVERIRASVLCLVNEQRGAGGLVPLVDSPQLQVAAQRHSDDMVARSYFGHITPDGTDFDARIFDAGYADAAQPITWDILAENIAWGTEAIATPARTVENWMASPAHRANILNATLRESGIGVALAAPQAGLPGRGATYTQDFGTR